MDSTAVKRKNESPENKLQRNIKLHVTENICKFGLLTGKFIVNDAGRLQPVTAVVQPTSCIVSEMEIKAFFSLLDDDQMIQRFLRQDSCYKVTDKYLLVMVFVYFKRAQLKLQHYNRMHFFLALYLANDMEEDEEDEKYQILPWALGSGWRWRARKFFKKRDKLWKKMNHRAIVSFKTCEEYIGLAPHHKIWQRNRPKHHAGAYRHYGKNSVEKADYLFGTNRSPQECTLCYPDSGCTLTSGFSTLSEDWQEEQNTFDVEKYDKDNIFNLLVEE